MFDEYPVNYPELIVNRSTGNGESEKKLAALIEKVFFPLWTYPNPYKESATGQELCDVLVVFGDNILIFSDKNCSFQEDKDFSVVWNRWFKKSVFESVSQLEGAKKWITVYPERIFVDPQNKNAFPLNIKITEKTRFHLIAVVHNSGEACKKYFDGGNGSLYIDNRIVREEHLRPENAFKIGLVSKNNDSFIHVFDDFTLDTIFTSLNTATDFINYLVDREVLLNSNKIVMATGELELLATHIYGTLKNRTTALNDLLIENYDFISFEEGLWEELIESKSFLKWNKQIGYSYLWDNIIKDTCNVILSGKSYYTNCHTIEEQSRLFSIVASENRKKRKILSDWLYDAARTAGPNVRLTRILYSKDKPDICYVLLILPRTSETDYAEYRHIRGEMLRDYCEIAKLEIPTAVHFIGIAHENESNGEDNLSEDFIYCNFSNWDDKMRMQAEMKREEYRKAKCYGKLKKSQSIKFR